jgi:hypothetical protein
MGERCRSPDREGQRAYIAVSRILVQKLDGEIVVAEHVEETGAMFPLGRRVR